MSIQSPKLLFIPVSSPEGIGEYMRSMIIADAVKQKWPDAQIRFVINHHAPYAKDCHYPTELLDDTPTKCVKAVNSIISAFRPDIVLFDASGRKSQLAHAAKSGAKVIFLSQHKSKRSRGMKIGRAKHTDLHWVVQPEFVIGKISRLDKWKLSLINKPEPVNIGPVFSPPNEEQIQDLMSKFRLTAGEFVLFNAGSGGHKVGSELAADVFLKLASYCKEHHTYKPVIIFGANYPSTIPQLDGITCIDKLSNCEFISLLSASKAAVLSGGDTLLQSISLLKPTLALPVSKDQPKRIKVCVDNKLVLTSNLELNLAQKALELLLQPKQMNGLIDKMTITAIPNGLELSIQELTNILGGINE
jgi:spore coat polysaccharide biosynthesis predicted glycosyltransferase SpsG